MLNKEFRRAARVKVRDTRCVVPRNENLEAVWLTTKFQRMEVTAPSSPAHTKTVVSSLKHDNH